ncbi:FAD-binding oxidoreductase [Herbiconiux daphne]|uniref:FAD-binding oxidoreductase n=1 Tax=Herbiconiux daphne TaxID=2970914 RepID=A0ABT2H439_9MICO|nr:FAD-binding oxidoreductase [Herbiconiux daphne]MCS5734699.1 FAD-binding oxidoreductase [Herbiconiux daphne]
MTTIPVLTEGTFDELAASLSGALHLPGTADYERLATPWNVAVPARAAAVVEAADAADVATAVRFANRAGIVVAVRATGHGASSDLDGQLLVHTGRLDELVVHEEGWARIGSGVKWGPVLEAAAPFGLAPLVGSAPDVGAVGYLTGGGLGPVARTYGIASDTVRAFDVVTGDGELRRATPDENPSLFWALRGGKGALGIVTAVEIDLVRQPTVYGGALFFSAADTDDVVRAWAEWSPGLDRQGTTSLAINRLPELPFLPEPIAGKQTVSVRFAWTGDPAEGERAFAAMASAAAPVFGGIGVMPYAAIGMIHSDPVDPLPSHEEFSLLRGLPADAVEALLDVAGAGAASLQLVTELRLLGGALDEPSAQPSAFGEIDAAYTLLTVGIAAGPAVDLSVTDGRGIHEALAPWATGRQLPNFAPADDAEHIRRIYDESTLARLASLIAAFDPRGVIAVGRPLRAAVAAATA